METAESASLRLAQVRAASPSADRGYLRFVADVSASPTPYSRGEVSLDTLPNGGEEGVLQWVFDAGAAIRGPLVAGPDSVYFVSADHLLHALDRAGQEHWRTPALGLAPALGPRGVIYAQTGSDELAVYRPDGTELWRVADGRDARLLSVAADGTVFVGTADALLSISPEGHLNWRVDLGHVTAAVATSDGGVIAGVANGNIEALWHDGADRWNFAPAGGFSGGLAIGGETIYAGSGSGRLYALSLDGSEIWSEAISQAAAGIRSGPVVSAHGDLYFQSDQSYALGPDGQPKTLPVSPSIGEVPPLALLNGGVVLAGADGMIAMFNEDGSCRWGARLKSPVSATPAASSGLLYLGDKQGRVYAIK